MKRLAHVPTSELIDEVADRMQRYGDTGHSLDQLKLLRDLLNQEITARSVSLASFTNVEGQA